MSRTMKDSGIPWIGEIPEGWSIDTIGNLYALRNEKVSDKDYPPLSVTKQGIVPQLETAAKTDDGDNRKLVKVGDFAINSRSDRRGSCGISAYDGSVSLINTVITPREQMNPCFYNWLFHSELFADEFYKWGHGIVDDLWTTRWQEMKRIGIVTPPLADQHLIATFLDKKCSEIDSLIDLQEQMIEELKAYKQSVITEAVTKGLNPNVPMKDSGIEWIGQIPEHWEVSRVGLHYEIILGKMLCDKPIENGFLLPYFCAANVHFEGISTTNLKQMWYNLEELNKYRVCVGDLLVVEGGAGAGGCAMVKYIEENICIQNSIMIVRSKHHCNRFLRYLVESLIKRDYVDFVCNKATIPHFTKDKLANVPYAFPKLTEQQAIANYLDEKCADIDSLIQTKLSKIDSLKEYKKSVIYEYVTGKREVE